MPTIKQKKAFKAVMEKVENGSTMKDALVRAGYSENTAKAPTKVTNSEGWQELLQKYMPDDKLAKRHEEFLYSDREEIGIKALDMSYKLKDKYPKDSTPNLAIQVNLTQVIEKVNSILDA